MTFLDIFANGTDWIAPYFADPELAIMWLNVLEDTLKLLGEIFFLAGFWRCLELALGGRVELPEAERQATPALSSSGTG